MRESIDVKSCQTLATGTKREFRSLFILCDGSTSKPLLYRLATNASLRSKILLITLTLTGLTIERFSTTEFPVPSVFF